MKKVTIEVTATGWTITMLDGKKTLVKKHVRTPTGAQCVEVNYDEDKDISEELYDALGSFTFYDIMIALVLDAERLAEEV